MWLFSKIPLCSWQPRESHGALIYSYLCLHFAFNILEHPHISSIWPLLSCNLHSKMCDVLCFWIVIFCLSLVRISLIFGNINCHIVLNCSLKWQENYQSYHTLFEVERQKVTCLSSYHFLEIILSVWHPEIRISEIAFSLNCLEMIVLYT